MNKQMNIPQLRFPEFAGEWEKKKLGGITNWASGGTPPKDNSDYWNGDIPWISASSMRGTNYSDSELKITIEGLKNGSKIAKKGTLLILVRGSMLFNKIPIGIATKDVAFNQDVKSIVVDKTTDTTYILQWFISSEPKIMNMVTGTGIGAGKLDLDELKGIQISFPTLPEQTKIATFLTAVDEKLQALKKKKSLLEDYKKGVMQKLFCLNHGLDGFKDDTDFDNESVESAQSLKIRDSDNVRFRQKDGSDFPDWEVKKLGEVCEIVGGGTPETNIEEYWNGNIQWFTPTEIKSDYVSKSKRTITELGLQKSSAKKLPVGTILLTTRATIGEASIALEECTTNQGFQSLIAKEGNNNVYIFNWIKMNKHELTERANGSTFPEISKSEIEKIEISIPSLPEQTQIANFLSALDEKISQTHTQITQTETWKKGLLQKMFC